MASRFRPHDPGEGAGAPVRIRPGRPEASVLYRRMASRDPLAQMPPLFIDTVRSGRHFGRGRPILPPMPTQNVAVMTDADLRAVFAYLRSIPAIKNRVPEPRPPAVVSNKKEPASTPVSR